MVTRRRRHSLHRRRRGYTLVVFALIFFCLMALGALVVDLGLARLTQRQMQTAVDSAAPEALRGDRNRASRFADFVFDDDGDLDIATGNDPRWQRLEDQRSNPSIDSRFIDVVQRYTFDPVAGTNLPHLQTNNGDVPGGDMVGFQRPDDLDPSVSRPAVLVQLRRTGEPPSEAQSIGPRLPYLFARGSLLGKGAAGINIQAGSGIALRAEATADARPAKAVGKRPEFPPDVDALEIPGALPFVLPASWWSPASFEVIVTPGQSELRASGETEPGFVLDVDLTDGMGLPLSFGQVMPAAAVPGPAYVADMVAAAAQRTNVTGTSQAFGFVGLVSSLNEPSGAWLVGFGAAYIASSPQGFTVEPLPNHIASRNASSVPTAVFDAAFQDSSSGAVRIQALITAHHSISPPVLAPAGVR